MWKKRERRHVYAITEIFHQLLYIGRVWFKQLNNNQISTKKKSLKLAQLTSLKFFNFKGNKIYQKSGYEDINGKKKLDLIQTSKVESDKSVYNYVI